MNTRPTGQRPSLAETLGSTPLRAADRLPGSEFAHTGKHDAPVRAFTGDS